MTRWKQWERKQSGMKKNKAESQKRRTALAQKALLFLTHKTENDALVHQVQPAKSRSDKRLMRRDTNNNLILEHRLLCGVHQDRIKSAERKKKLSFQRICQLAFAVLINGYMAGFLKGKIFTGSSKAICVPVLNCYLSHRPINLF